MELSKELKQIRDAFAKYAEGKGLTAAEETFVAWPAFREAWKTSRQAAERDTLERAAKVASEGTFTVSRVQENISTMDNIEMAVRAVQDMITSAIRSLANG